MSARLAHVPPVESVKFLLDQVNRLIKTYESSHVSVQVVTTVVPDNRSQSGSKVYYEAFITYPA